MGAPIDLLPVTQKTWVDIGSSYGGQETLVLSALAGADTYQGEVEGVGEAVRSVGATETPPTRPMGGNPWLNFAPPTSHIVNQEGGMGGG